MTEFNRDFFKKDPVIGRLWKIIIKQHKTPDHTIKTLLENKHIKNFCVNTRHFMIAINGRGENLYLHYNASTWYETTSAPVRIESIGIYDNYVEYESCRQKELGESKISDGLNLN